MQLNKTLPDKPSALLAMALDDLASVETMPDKYCVNMQAWHDPTGLGICEVCFAGAVVACGMPAAMRSRTIIPTKFETPICDKMLFLEVIRKGSIEFALLMLGLSLPAEVTKEIDVAIYANNPAAWREDMNRIVEMLAEAGL